MYYNPMANILFRLLGQAAAQGFANESRRAASESQQYASPFDEMFGGDQTPQDDAPIDVEAEVIGDDGKTEKDRAHESWDAKRKANTANQLSGEVMFAGSKSYSIAIGVISALLLIAGIAARIYTLIMGQIFSATIVPVALGALAGIVMAFIAAAMLWKLGSWKVPFDAADPALVFLSAALMGYANLPCALIASVIGAIYMKARPNKKLPFFAVYIAIGAIWALTMKFPGLAL